MNHFISSKNWTSALADAIVKAQHGDAIIVLTEAQKELGEHARLRMCPDKMIDFIVWTEEDGDN